MNKLLVHEKVQNMHPQDVSLLREDYFELKSIQILEVQEILLRESILQADSLRTELQGKP